MSDRFYDSLGPPREGPVLPGSVNDLCISDANRVADAQLVRFATNTVSWPAQVAQTLQQVCEFAHLLPTRPQVASALGFGQFCPIFVGILATSSK